MIRALRPALLGLVLIDIPFFAVVLVAGLFWGFEDVAVAYLRWREENPWTFLVSIALLSAFVIWRVRRSQR